MDIFIDAHQYRKINKAERRADIASEKAGRAQNAYHELERKMNRMSLACQAMLELLQEKVGVSDEEVEAKILEVDLRDGKADGKIGNQIVECETCGKKANTARGTCYYCGADISDRHVFE